MNLFVSNFIQFYILNIGKAIDTRRWEKSTSVDPSVQTLPVQILCYVMTPQCPLDYDVTSAHETLRLLFLKAAPVSIKDIWLIFCFSWAPQITRHIGKCAQCYASFLTFHLWAALSLPTGQLKVKSWELAGGPCAAADLSCHRSLRN